MTPGLLHTGFSNLLDFSVMLLAARISSKNLPMRFPG